MIAVVLVAYTIQPLIFRFFIAYPASKGLPPYTLIGLIRTVLLFLLFFIGCIVLRILIILLYPVPVRKSSKQRLVCRPIQITCKGILLLLTAVKKNISTKPTNASGIRQLSLPTTSRSSTFWYCCLFHLKILDGNQPLGMALSFLRSHHSLCRLLLYRRKIRAIYGTDAEKSEGGLLHRHFPRKAHVPITER